MSAVGGDVASLGVVCLAAGERRIEDAHQSQLTPDANHVGVVLVECVHDSGADPVASASREVLDLSLAVEAEAGLEVMAILEMQLCTGGDGRVGEREPHRVVTHQQPPALPTLATHVSWRPDHVVNAPNDHPLLSLIPYPAAPLRGAIIGQ